MFVLVVIVNVFGVLAGWFVFICMGCAWGISDLVAEKIDNVISMWVDEGYNKAWQIFSDNIDDFHKIAKALITYETLTGEEIENIINKNVYPADKQDLKVEDDKGSAMGALGLKPKIVH